MNKKWSYYNYLTRQLLFVIRLIFNGFLVKVNINWNKEWNKLWFNHILNEVEANELSELIGNWPRLFYILSKGFNKHKLYSNKLKNLVEPLIQPTILYLSVYMKGNINWTTRWFAFSSLLHIIFTTFVFRFIVAKLINLITYCYRFANALMM